MSSGSKPKKPNKVSRPSTRKMTNQYQSMTCDGVYGDARLVYSLINSMGSRCTVQVQNGDMFSGVFHTVSPQMDIVLAAAHKLSTTSSTTPLILDSSIPLTKDIISELIFQYSDIVHLEIHDTNMNFAEVSVKSNGDSGVDAKFSSTNGAERSLEPWDGGGDTTTDLSLEDVSAGGTFSSHNGWGAEDMFRTNQEQYGVKSSYNPEMLEYTTRLENENTADYEKRKARADKLAHEIENSANYIKNISVEVDDSTTEEEKYSSVIRDNNNMSKYGRGRGRPRDHHMRNQRSGPGYYQQGPGGMGRSVGPFGPGRSNTPTNSGESPTSPPGTGKNFSKQGGQVSRPPRFEKRMGGPPREGGNSHNKDEDRAGRLHDNRMYDNASINPSYGGPKPPRPGNQGRGAYAKPSNPPDYAPHMEGPISSLSGQSAPHPVSRDSSSLNQQPIFTPWKEEDRMHPTAPPPASNPQLSRSYPSPGVRGERFRAQLHKVQVIPRILGRPSRSCKQPENNSFPSSAAGAVPGMTEHTGAPGSYLDKGVKQSHHPGFRPTISSAASGPPHHRLIFTPKGYSLPVGSTPPNPGVLTPMMPPPTGQVYRPPHMLPPQQPPPSRFPMATTAASTVPPTSTVPPSGRRPNSHTEVAGKSASTTKLPPTSAPASQPIALSKSNSTGSSKERTTKRLKDFQDNFNLQLPDSSAADAPQAKPAHSVASGTRSKSVDETPPTRPPQTSNQPRNPAPSNVAPAEPLAVATSTQPPLNVVSSSSPTSPSDVKTVSAGTGPIVAAPSEPSTQQAPAATSQKPASDVTALPSDAPTSTSNAEATNPAATSDLKLNPDAKEFKPRSFTISSRSVTPQSPTPLPQQAQTGSYYNPTGQILTAPSQMYFVSQKPSIPKQGQTILSPTPTDQSVMINTHLHPSTVGPIITPTAYPATAPVVFAQGPAGQQIATGQHAIMHQQTFPAVEPMLYTPTPHMVPANPRGIPAYPTGDYNYQQSQAIPIQPHQPSPQHHPQPAVTPQQAPSAQQASNYMNQQRPHSAHTPTAQSHIRPPSPATNIQPQAVSASHSVALHHHHTSNAVIAQQGYFQQPILTQYQVPRQYMMLTQNSPHLAASTSLAQPGYSSSVVGNTAHNQAQFQGRRQYSQPVMHGYQQQPPN